MKIVRGEVLSLRQVCENQAFVPFKDDPPDPDKATSTAEKEPRQEEMLKYTA